MVDPVLHSKLRLARGAFRTSPIQSLYVEYNQWGLEQQRTYTNVTYAVKVTSVADHPCNDIIKDTSAMRLFKSPVLFPCLSRYEWERKRRSMGSLNEIYRTSNNDLLAPWEVTPVATKGRHRENSFHSNTNTHSQVFTQMPQSPLTAYRALRTARASTPLRQWAEMQAYLQRKHK